MFWEVNPSLLGVVRSPAAINPCAGRSRPGAGVGLERGGGRSRGIWVPRVEGKDVWNLHCVTGGQWCRDLRLHVKPADRHGGHARGAPRASHVPSPVPHGP